MFCNIYNVSIIIKFKYSLKFYELKNTRGSLAGAYGALAVFPA